MSNDGEDKWRAHLQRSPESRLLEEEMRSRLRELLEPYISSGRSLLIAHGAAILAVLQFLAKEGGRFEDKFHLLAGTFCIGFCLAALGQFAGFYARQNYMSYAWEKPTSTGVRELWVCGMFLALSFLLLLFAIGGVGFSLVMGEFQK